MGHVVAFLALLLLGSSAFAEGVCGEIFDSVPKILSEANASREDLQLAESRLAKVLAMAYGDRLQSVVPRSGRFQGRGSWQVFSFDVRVSSRSGQILRYIVSKNASDPSNVASINGPHPERDYETDFSILLNQVPGQKRVQTTQERILKSYPISPARLRANVQTSAPVRWVIEDLRFTD